MRIIGGTARGLHLSPVGEGDAKAHLRPTSDRVRESIFNLLVNGKLDGGPNPLPNARVLDLFAGTGALGLEALSRGADFACFIDDGPAAQTLLKRNIALMRAADRSSVMRYSATRLPAAPKAPFSLIFLDPPYGKALGEAALASASAAQWIAPSAVIVWEESTAPLPPVGFAVIDQRRYGDTHITLLRAPA